MNVIFHQCVNVKEKIEVISGLNEVIFSNVLIENNWKGDFIGARYCVLFDIFFVSSLNGINFLFVESHKVKAELIHSLSVLGKAIPERTDLQSSIIALAKQASTCIQYKIHSNSTLK